MIPMRYYSLTRGPAPVPEHDRFARDAVKGCHDRWWCVSCRSHRVRVEGAACPCCTDVEARGR